MTFRTLPYSELVRAPGSERVLVRVQGHRADTLLVVGESFGATVGSNVPKADHLIVGAGDDLWLVGLAFDRFDRVLVAGQHSDRGLGPDIPNPGGGVPTASDQQIQLWMQSATVDP